MKGKVAEFSIIKISIIKNLLKKLESEIESGEGYYETGNLTFDTAQKIKEESSQLLANSRYMTALSEFGLEHGDLITRSKNSVKSTYRVCGCNTSGFIIAEKVSGTAKVKKVVLTKRSDFQRQDGV